MGYYLISEEGPYEGLVVDLNDDDKAIVGRDPDLATSLIEDPSISRKHALFTFSGNETFIENLSLTNPLQVNGQIVEGRTKIVENDYITLGLLIFRFKKKAAVENKEIFKQEEKQIPSQPLFHFSLSRLSKSRYYMKVVSGPNLGAEFPLLEAEEYILGKDEEESDIAFQDMSVSKKHARLFFSGANIPVIEDLNSLNKVFVNQRKIDAPYELKGQDIITLGTTQLVLVDKEAVQETLFTTIKEALPLDEEIIDETTAQDRIKKLVIPYKHMVAIGLFSLIIFVGAISLFSLFSTTEIHVSVQKQQDEIMKVMKRYKGIEYTYSPSSGRIFMIGHLLNEQEHEELIYLIQELSFIKSVDDSIVIDELVWQNANAMLQTNGAWRNVLITATRPGQFVLRGYLESSDQQGELLEYITLNFPYLSRLKNELCVIQIIQQKLQSIMNAQGFGGINFSFSLGDLVLSGLVDIKEKEAYLKLVEEIQRIPGIQQVQDIVAYATDTSTRVNLSDKYKVNGSSTQNGVNQFVLINGKILSKGKSLDGMLITGIDSDEILLEKDGVKYKIDFNS